MYQLGVHSLISYHLLFPGSSPLSSLANESSSDGVRPTVRIQPYKKTDVVLQTSCLGGLNLVQGLWSPSFLAGKSCSGGVLRHCCAGQAAGLRGACLGCLGLWVSI